MTVLWSCRALCDLDAVAAYIAERDPDNVDRVVASISVSVLRYSRLLQLGRASSPAGTREIAVPRLP